MDRGALDTDAGQLVDDPLRGPAHLRGAIRIGADALDAEELVELGEVLGVVLAQVCDRGIRGRGGIGLACHAPMIAGMRADAARSGVPLVRMAHRRFR